MSASLPAHRARIRHEMTTTAFALDGFQTVQTLGVVMGITVRSALSAPCGRPSVAAISDVHGACNRPVEAFELMLSAEQHGANAIIGVRYDANEVTRRSPILLRHRVVGSRVTG
jgi:uncharacterized protein YbjQ (UPF0145 family)